jgi:hypothetical protein
MMVVGVGGRSSSVLQNRQQTTYSSSRAQSTIVKSAAFDEESIPNELLLDANAVQQEMAGLKSKYPTSEADYLAAARARAAAQVASKNDGATDEDWLKVKQEAAQQGGVNDDWEVSAREAGNSDSQILIPMAPEDADDDEPKLMLF